MLSSPKGDRLRYTLQIHFVASNNVAGVAKWAIQLAGHTILYEPRTTIKSQALADFLVEWTETQYLPPPPDSTHWRMHFDGSKM